MSYFQTLKDNITCRDAAERYGLRVSRSGMAVCPFHEDHDPSLKLGKRFYCFGCGAKGDVIDFTARLLDLSNYDAAQRLAADFGIYPRPPNRKNVSESKPGRISERQCQSILLEYYRLLSRWKKQYAPQSPGDPFHEKFVNACHQESFIAHMIDEMSDADPWRREQVMKFWMEDDRIHRLQKFVLKHKEETIIEKEK